MFIFWAFLSSAFRQERISLRFFVVIKKFFHQKFMLCWFEISSSFLQVHTITVFWLLRRNRRKFSFRTFPLKFSTKLALSFIFLLNIFFSSLSSSFRVWKLYKLILTEWNKFSRILLFFDIFSNLIKNSLMNIDKNRIKLSLAFFLYIK